MVKTEAAVEVEETEKTVCHGVFLPGTRGANSVYSGFACAFCPLRKRIFEK